ncbi:MAG: hypothetical protein OJF55_002837 [Rhodanobacteraceae bacterium]|nr:MAG: hypothetical protein OJF55_002837 [Rhodanobacteraceae bacterium]
MKRTSLAIFTALVCASAPFLIGRALAQQAAASSPSDQLDRFAGEGICTGRIMAMGKDPGHATTGKFRSEKVLDGHWIVIHYDEDKTAANPKPFSVVQYIGYDKARKQFIAVAFDNSGSPYGTGTSRGWKGDTITFDETAEGAKGSSYRDTFAHGDSGMSSHTGTMRGKNGKWVKTDEETCRKA